MYFLPPMIQTIWVVGKTTDFSGVFGNFTQCHTLLRAATPQTVCDAPVLSSTEWQRGMDNDLLKLEVEWIHRATNFSPNGLIEELPL